MEISACQFSLRSKQEVEKRGEETVEKSGHRRNQEGDSDEDEECGQEAEERLMIDGLLESKDEGEDEKAKADEAEMPEPDLYFCFKGPQRQGLPGCNLGGLSCRPDRGKNGGKDPQPKPCHQDERGDRRDVLL